MKSDKPIFTSPQDVEAAFYAALEKGDLDAMMALWAEEEDIVCVHPGGPRLVGYRMIRDAWREIFESGIRVRLEILATNKLQTPFTAIHSLIERVAAPDSEEQAPLVATNVYVRGALGWRMVVHHASPMPPSALSETPKILH